MNNRDELLEELRQEMARDGLCPCCLKKAQAYWHPITKLRIHALQKMYAAVIESHENLVDVGEAGLDYAERSSLSILRFHALIAKKLDSKGHQNRRQWVITHRGAQFLRNQMDIPLKVKTYQNRVVDHSTEMVSIIEVLGYNPDLPPTEPFERALPTSENVKVVQRRLL